MDPGSDQETNEDSMLGQDVEAEAVVATKEQKKKKKKKKESSVSRGETHFMIYLRLLQGKWFECLNGVIHCRALCRIKLLPVTHVLVDTWMLTVKLVYKLLNVSDGLKWTTNTRVTPFSLNFKA